MFAMRYRNIGLKIAYYRKKKGYTQTELAQRIGMSVAYLGQIERGNRGNSFLLRYYIRLLTHLRLMLVFLWITKGYDSTLSYRYSDEFELRESVLRGYSKKIYYFVFIATKSDILCRLRLL